MPAVQELTSAQVEALAESWEPVRRSPRENGPLIFYIFFQQFPQYVRYFKDLRGLSLDEMRTHPKLRLHGIRVLYALSSLVDSADDFFLAREIMTKTVDNHWPRGLKEDDFKTFFSILPSYLETVGGSPLEPATRDAWICYAGFLLDVIRERLRELEQQQDEKTARSGSRDQQHVEVSGNGDGQDRNPAVQVQY